jgi:ABC-2 type transport system ATP-binding protein
VQGKALVSAQRFVDKLTEPFTIHFFRFLNLEVTSGAMIQVGSLSKRFGQFTAVDNVSFEVGQSEIFAFLGPNGAGKTTTIKMLTTLLRPTSGTMKIDGLDPNSRPHEVRKRFGIVFQDPSVDGDLTAYENMELHGVFYHVPRKTRISRIEQLLRLFELWDRRNDQVKLFSGGMKRRLEIARALLHTPKVLFLDEPTLGLDPQTRNQLWTQVKHLNQTEGVTVFLTTHYMDEADRVAQRIAIIDHGKIVAQGSPQELKQQTNRNSLEEAFLALTGSTIRDEAASATDHMREFRKLWSSRR